MKSNLDALLAVAQAPNKGHSRTLNFHFFSSPKEILGSDRVNELIFTKNVIKDGKVQSSGEQFSVKAGLIISAIGYEAVHIEGIPYENGRVLNMDGKIKDSNMYVVGWAKRGPSGVIGTNKSDAAEVVKLLISELKEPKSKNGIESLIRERGIIHVSQAHWHHINQAEVAKGEPLNKPRVKFVDRKEMLGFAG